MDVQKLKMEPQDILIYHITNVNNLPKILEGGCLFADSKMSKLKTNIIGHAHIKERRLNEIKIDCCGGKFVGEFVPFYFCNRSPMLFSINKGNTGMTAGSQDLIVHLVSRLSVAMNTGSDWCISTSNAGARNANFGKLEALYNINWDMVHAMQWQYQSGAKSAEFLVADKFPWTGFHLIGCFDQRIVDYCIKVFEEYKIQHKPEIRVERSWYY